MITTILENMPLLIAVFALCLSLDAMRLNKKTAKLRREMEYRLLLRLLIERGHLGVSERRWNAMLETVTTWAEKAPNPIHVSEVKATLQDALITLTGSPAATIDGPHIHGFVRDLVFAKQHAVN